MDKDDYQKWLDMVKKEVNEEKSEQKFELSKSQINESNGEIKSEVKPEVALVKEEDSPEEPVKDPLIDQFLSEIGDIKSEAFKTSSKEQLDRLLRPGSTYFNLNPFETLQIDPYCPVEEMRKKYRKLSMYVHPDKNRDDKERADIAFEAVNRAYKMLDDEKERKKCLEVVEEAREQVDKTCEEKRKKLRREAVAAAAAAAEKSKSSKSRFSEPESKPTSTSIDEDDPDKYRHAIYVMTCKLFADIERLKVRERERQQEEKKRKADEKEHDASKSKVKKEWDKNYEDSREGRVTSWQNFARKPIDHDTKPPVEKDKVIKAKPVTKVKPALFFRPPKHKPETR